MIVDGSRAVPPTTLFSRELMEGRPLFGVMNVKLATIQGCVNSPSKARFITDCDDITFIVVNITQGKKFVDQSINNSNVEDHFLR